MALGVWFQWLSGNLIQILVQQNLEDEGLGQLRILLSSFGFMSIYFQHREIMLARKLISGQKEIKSSSLVDAARDYAIPVTLIVACAPVYRAYCWLIEITFYPDVAAIYALYQFLVLISVEKRVHLRVMADMSFTSIGYVAMVLLIVALAIIAPSFDLLTAAWLYLASIVLMVIVLSFGQRIVKSRGERDDAA
jgi:hypothetical protein